MREVAPWLNGVVGEGWQAATSQKGHLTPLVGTHASNAALPWNLVAAKHHDFFFFKQKTAYEI